MAYQVLARKLRPKKFQEVVGQDHIVRSLANSLRLKKVGHAYLFSGTRGIGKTTVARIFARALRCQNRQEDGNPCGSCQSCIDQLNDLNIIEIDGASNNSVDEVRTLISNVQYLPTVGTFKVYIIDEVHMLSQSAFNALLKTLEEPPSHVIFIFATTVPEKLPETVLSRCQRFDFKNASHDVLVRYIESIALKENITFQGTGIIEEICRVGDGSLRDTLSSLDRVLCYTTDNVVTEEILLHALGIAKRSLIKKLAVSMIKGDVSQVSTVYREMAGENVSIDNLAHALLDEFFDIIQTWNDETPPSYSSMTPDFSEAELFWIYEELVRDFHWALGSLDPYRVVEIVLRKITKRRDFLNLTPSSKKEEKKDNWDAFLDFVGQKSFGLKSHLEKGNILGIPATTSGKLFVKLAFPSGASIFFEYLRDKEDEILNYVEEFYGVKKEDIVLEMKIIDDDEAKKENFKSKNQEIAEKNERIIQQKKQNIATDPMIKKAETLFNAKVDAIKVKEQKGGLP